MTREEWARRPRRESVAKRFPGLAKAVRERDEGRCYRCAGPADTIDHIVPVAVGGRTVSANLRLACRSCNSRRGAVLSRIAR